MKFGPVAAGAAHGAIAAHTLRLKDHIIRKGSVLSHVDVEALLQADVTSLVVAQLEAGDVHEDEAALRLARAIAGAGVRLEAPTTGRVNLYAMSAGLVSVETATINALNAIDEGITVATLAAYTMVEAGRMIGTVKIIPYGIEGAKIALAEEATREPALSLTPFRLRNIALVQTFTPGMAVKVLDKTRRITDSRLVPMDARVTREWRVPHEEGALAKALVEAKAQSDLMIVFGASAISDRRDVIPAAVVAAGGEVIHLGMPVDPGNLLLLGRLGTTPTLGAPGCARSPKENGFDMVLSRLIAGLQVHPHDITRLGVGGLLMEISSRPQPREGKALPVSAPRIEAIVLAAGRSTRFGADNKLIADLNGKPIIRHVVEALCAAQIAVVVVTGHQADAIMAVLDGLPLRFAHNPDFADGMASSLAKGIAALAPDCDGALIALGDMPAIDQPLINALTAAFAPQNGRSIITPVFSGKRGHPVLWARRYFADLSKIEGDTGARHLLGLHQDETLEVEWLSDSVLADVDTPDALLAFTQKSGL